ncbi:MAG: hypothetical protein U0270_02250 [Labilithrix sp.]
MWPFHRTKPRALSLPEVPLDRPTVVSGELVVVSPNDVVSPVTGTRAAVLAIEAFEQLSLAELQEDAIEPANPAMMTDRYRSRGAIRLGHTLVLGDDAGVELAVPLRLARLTFATDGGPKTRLRPVPPELADRFGLTDEREMSFCEQTLRTGDRVRLAATVEARATPTPSGYRSGVGTLLVVRDDLGPVVLEELLEPPDG